MESGSSASDFLTQKSANFFKKPSVGSADVQLTDFKQVRGCPYCCCQQHAASYTVPAIILFFYVWQCWAWA